MLSVRELLEGLESELPVLAGEGGLDLPVRWVHISELADPTPWLSGGELLLTTGMQLQGSEQQHGYVSRLSDHHLAGLGFGVGIAHDSVPGALLEAAEERGFPVFEIPYELPFIAITEAVFTRLVNDQYAVLRRALAAQERLERIVLAQRGLDALAGALAGAIGGTVVVLDARGEPLALHEFRHSLSAQTRELLGEEVRARRSRPRPFIPPVHEDEQALALPVGAESQLTVPDAWIVAIKDEAPLSDFDRLTLRQAVTIVALELLRERVAGDTERRLAGDVLRALADGELAGAELSRRLAPFGVGERVAALVLAAVGDAGSAYQHLEAQVRGALREETTSGLVASADSVVCALVPGLQDAELFSLAGRLAQRVGSMVGAGRAQAVGEARRSFHEARCALEARSMSAGRREGDQVPTPGVATYRDLGTFQLLLSLQDDDALELFHASILGPIEASDSRYGGELMRSLEAFIEENGQWERAARRLYCHRHTLRYRIKRIEELTGRSLSSARDRIEFWLALRARELARPLS